MSRSPDLPPLADGDGGGDAPDGLRALLRGAREDGISPAELRGLQAGVAARLPGGAPAAAAHAGVAKLVAAAVVGVGAGGGAVLWALSHFAAPADVPAAAPVPAVSEPVPAPAAAAARPTAPSPPESAVAHPARSATAPVAAEPEDALVDRAQRALAADPAAALRLAGEHARLYPAGELAQEREVVAVTALARLGRGEEAHARAAAFKRRWPTSAHVRKVDDALAAMEKKGNP